MFSINRVLLTIFILSRPDGVHAHMLLSLSQNRRAIKLSDKPSFAVIFLTDRIDKPSNVRQKTPSPLVPIQTLPSLSVVIERGLFGVIDSNFFRRVSLASSPFPVISKQNK